jgi:hypothetical protein
MIKGLHSSVAPLLPFGKSCGLTCHATIHIRHAPPRFSAETVSEFESPCSFVVRGIDPVIFGVSCAMAICAFFANVFIWVRGTRAVRLGNMTPAGQRNLDLSSFSNKTELREKRAPSVPGDCQVRIPPFTNCVISYCTCEIWSEMHVVLWFNDWCVCYYPDSHKFSQDFQSGERASVLKTHKWKIKIKTISMFPWWLISLSNSRLTAHKTQSVIDFLRSLTETFSVMRRMSFTASQLRNTSRRKLPEKFHKKSHHTITAESWWIPSSNLPIVSAAISGVFWSSGFRGEPVFWSCGCRPSCIVLRLTS